MWRDKDPPTLPLFLYRWGPTCKVCTRVYVLQMCLTGQIVWEGWSFSHDLGSIVIIFVTIVYDPPQFSSPEEDYFLLLPIAVQHLHQHCSYFTWSASSCQDVKQVNPVSESIPLPVEVQYKQVSYKTYTEHREHFGICKPSRWFCEGLSMKKRTM